VPVAVGVPVGVFVDVDVLVMLGVSVMVGVSVIVGGVPVIVAVGDTTGDSVFVGVAETIGVSVSVSVAVLVGVLHITVCEYPPAGTGHAFPFTALKYVSLAPCDIALNVIMSKFGFVVSLHGIAYATVIVLPGSVTVPPWLLVGIPTICTPAGIVITSVVIGPLAAAFT